MNTIDKLMAKELQTDRKDPELEQDWKDSHYICRECDTETWDNFFYPDQCRVCNTCRIKIGIFDQDYYKNLWKERGEEKR